MAPVAPGSGSDGGAVVAVTGATGFIGSHVCDALLAAGYRVRAVVRSPNDEERVAHLRGLAGAAERLTLHGGRLEEPGSYDAAFVGADAVIHTAAVVEINEVTDPEREIVKPSVEGTKNVLASADRSGSVKRFVHTSSELAAMKWDEDLASTFGEASWNTASTVANGDPYGFAKVTAERLVLDHSGSGFDCVSVLPGVNLGPCMTKAHTKSSAVVVRQLMYGNRQPDYRSHFVDVRDTAAAHVAALATDVAAAASIEEGGRRFLAVSDSQMQVRDLEPVLQQLFPDLAWQAKPLAGQFLAQVPLLWRIVMARFQQVMMTQQFNIDNKKSKTELGLTYRPFEDTLRDCVKSMVDTGFVKPRKKA